MKAVQLHGQGGVDQLRYGDTQAPLLTESGEAIVKLNAAALNRRDLMIRRGETKANIRWPVIPGSDGAGIVVAVGENVKSLRAGDAVCLYPWWGCGRCEACATDRETLCMEPRLLGEAANGTYAEYVRVPARNCFPMPPHLSFEEAAACPSVFLHAWRLLVSDAGMKPGETLLITGVGGGVAVAALQLATRLGAHVIVTSASDEKLALARSHGAAQGINHRTTEVPAAVRSLTNKRGVDVALDCVGGDGWAKTLASLAKGGRLVSSGAMGGIHPATDLRRIFWNHLRILGSRTGTRSEFHQVLNFLAVSQIKPIIDRVFFLEDAALAQERLAEGRQFGKIVLRVDG